jgi:hypothetical protein
MATILAQPILRLFLSHLGISLQASHFLSRMIPMPQDEEASTQNSIGDTRRGLESEELEKLADSWVCHQVMSARMLGLGG